MENVFKNRINRYTEHYIFYTVIVWILWTPVFHYIFSTELNRHMFYVFSFIQLFVTLIFFIPIQYLIYRLIKMDNLRFFSPALIYLIVIFFMFSSKEVHLFLYSSFFFLIYVFLGIHHSKNFKKLKEDQSS